MKENLLQDIWKKHIDVQEQMLRLRSVPVSIIPDSVKIIGDNLYLTADENDKSDRILNEIAATFNISSNEIDIEKGFFYADISVELNEKQRKDLSEKVGNNFISASFLPVIDGSLSNTTGANQFDCEKIEEQIREKFPSIKLKRDVRKKSIYFCQEYQTVEQGYRIREILSSELKVLVSATLLYQIPENKKKYVIDFDVQSKIESQTSFVKQLCGSNFFVGENDFGKLFRVSYPEMTFDISGANFEETKQLFESKNINSIEPNLTGDIEKIYRLRSSFNSILEGNNLHNPNLKDFIFDASKAKPIDLMQVNFRKELLCDNIVDFKSHLLNDRINESQVDAVIKTLLAEDLALIQGPPGTGKSTAIAEIIWQHVRRNPTERILLTSETNLAVDNAIDRIVNQKHNLVKPIRIGGEEKLEMEGRQFSLDVMKRWVENGIVEIDEEEKNEYEEILPQKVILQNWINNILSRINRFELDDATCALWYNFLSKPSTQVRQIFYDSYVRNCNIIGATCSSIGERNIKNNPTRFFKTYCEIFGKITTKTNRNDKQYTDYEGKIKFSTVIQDESSKATPAELSLPLIYGKKSIIIGDHRQLPPMLNKEEFMLSLDFLLDRTEKEDVRMEIKELKSFVNKHFHEMEISHFERLFEKIEDSLKGVFNLQYRMHPDINDVIKQFYFQDGGLECGLTNSVDLDVNDPDMKKSFSRYHGIEIDNFISKDNHVIWIDTNSPELLDGTSRKNYGEVEAIREVLTKFTNSTSYKQYQLFWSNTEDQQIGLISFYGKQISLLKKLCNEFREIPIRVSTVDRFQGMERNIIIVSLVRSCRFATHAKQKPDMNLYPELGFSKQNSLGFAQSPNRLNVALSRAKRLLIIVGNSELFRQKEIYDNVYKTIENNPNGKIITYNSFDYADKISTPISTINRSLNLNTLDIKKTDFHLRDMETWYSDKKDNPKIAVLELSTKAVKLLIADHERLLSDGFDFSCFIRDTQKTETGNGLDSNNKMDMRYFNRSVLYAIQKRIEIIKQNNVDVLYCVATAAYRTASNRDEIVKTIKEKTGVNVRILSKQEEAEATLWAYTFSRNNLSIFLKIKNIILIDQGGGSTEISLFKDQNLVKSHSFEIGTTTLKNIFFQKDRNASVKLALSSIDKESTTKIKEWLSEFKGEFEWNDAYCVCVGTAITQATGQRNSKNQHDKTLSKEIIINRIEQYTLNLANKCQTIGELDKNIKRDNSFEKYVVSRLGLPVILEIMDSFGINSLNVSGTGLWYGILFKKLYKID